MSSKAEKTKKQTDQERADRAAAKKLIQQRRDRNSEYSEYQKLKKQQKQQKSNTSKTVKAGDYPGAALSLVLGRVATTIAVAASGKTKTGDRAKVSAHQRKATPKQVRSKVAAELLKDTQTGQCPYCTGTYTVRSGVWKCSNDGCQSNFDPED